MTRLNLLIKLLNKEFKEKINRGDIMKMRIFAREYWDNTIYFRMESINGSEGHELLRKRIRK